MKAVMIHAARDLRIADVAATAPGPGQVRVRIGAGGICGSDLHYYQHGGFGVIRLKEPMVLGHEVAGTVEALGEGVSHVAVGARVAVSPSLPCGVCRFCQRGLQQHCLDMRFYGSAMRFPHVHGAFREAVVCEAVQVHEVTGDVSLGEAAMAEPLAVCLHAARRAGPLLGARVLVTGSGPIGVLAAIAARRAGAAEIVVTDIANQPLAYARSAGADAALNTAAHPEVLDPYKADKGQFDVCLEASGNGHALRAALDVVRPGGVIVTLGLGGEVSLPLNTVVAKEIELRGTFRFHEEFGLAVRMISRKLVDVKPLISHTMAVDDALVAFELAGDRSQAMKVQLSF